MPRILVPKDKKHEQDWKVLFKDDLANFPKGVELRSSATLPCARTLGPITKPPMDAFSHWETKTSITKKDRQARNENFTRRYWDAERMVQGFCETGKADRVFSENQCDQHPISVSWWWAIHGCEACKRTHRMKREFFKERVVDNIGPRFPEFGLTNPDLMNVKETYDNGSPRRVELEIDRHPLLRPPTPLRRDSSKSRTFSEADKKKKQRRNEHQADKYPYYHPLITSMKSGYTYSSRSVEQTARKLGREWSAPEIGWH